jgi:hypothetical protein
MKTLIKLLVALVVVAGIAYFTFFIPLGSKTLYRHLVGISKTDEAKALEVELEKKVKTTAKNVSKELKTRASELAEVKDKIVSGIDESDEQEPAAKDMEHSKEDRKALKDLVEEKDQPSERDRQALNRLVKKKNSGNID